MDDSRCHLYYILYLKSSGNSIFVFQQRIETVDDMNWKPSVYNPIYVKDAYDSNIHVSLIKMWNVIELSYGYDIIKSTYLFSISVVNPEKNI